jgi:superfamily II DNA or RNA helicase
LEQAIATFQRLWTGTTNFKQSLHLCRSYELKRYVYQDSPCVQFSTPQMLNQRQGKLATRSPIWDLIFFDEAHQALAPTFSDALSVARQTGKGLAPCIGLSATPGRSTDFETRSLIEMFQKRLLTSKLLGKNALSTLRSQGAVSFLHFKIIPHRNHCGSLTGFTEDLSARFRSLVALCKEVSEPSSTIIFTESVNHAIALALVLEYHGVRAGWVSSTMPNEQRREALVRFSRGEYSVLVNKSLLATGFDCPKISNAILATAIKSPILFEQMVGRASRGPKLGGNTEATIWSFEDHLKWHGEPSSYHRYATEGWR